MFEARFQSFDDPLPAQTGPRVQALRAELARRGLAGLILPRADRHQNEYVPPSEERLAWLSGFTGSAGVVIVLDRKAALFTDGRYTLQAATQIDSSVFATINIGETTPEKWIEQNLPSGGKLGYDPWLHTAEAAERLARACATAGGELVTAEPNPVDSIWHDRPKPPLGPGGAARSEIRRRGDAGQAAKNPRRDRQASRRRAGGLRSARGGLDLQHPRRRRGAHAAADRLRHRADSKAGPSLYIDGAKLIQRGAHQARRDRRGARAGRLHGRSQGARRRAPHRAARPGDRRRRAVAHRQRRRRKDDARARPDRDDEGGQEPDRDRGRAAGARPRRRGGDALPRLVRPRGAERETDRDRRGRGAGKLSPRHRLAQGRVVSEHLRRGARRRHRALPGDALDRPRHQVRRAVPDRLRRPIRGRHHRHHPHRRGRRAHCRKCASASPWC